MTVKNWVVLRICSILALSSYFSSEASAMTHDLAIPPFEATGEAAVNDKEFEEICSNKIREIIKSHNDVNVKSMQISNNDKFGYVCRVDFKTKYSEPDAINRIMLWKSAKNEVISFIGFNINARPVRKARH